MILQTGERIYEAAREKDRFWFSNFSAQFRTYASCLAANLGFNDQCLG